MMDNTQTIIAMLILLPISYEVFKDARSRGMNAAAWAIFVFLMLIIGLPAYFIMRKPKIEEAEEDQEERNSSEEYKDPI